MISANFYAYVVQRTNVKLLARTVWCIKCVSWIHSATNQRSV